MPKKKLEGNEALLEQLDHIKRLLMLNLIVSGVKAKDIATVLGVTKSTVSKIIPARAIGKLRKENDEQEIQRR